MEDWRPTSPLLNRRWLNFAQSAPPAWPAPVSSSEEPSVTPPAWLEGAQWQATPETTSWPEPIPTLPSTINDGPFDPPRHPQEATDAWTKSDGAAFSR
jgi:hypothetical protein